MNRWNALSGWIKANKWKLIAPIAVAAVLAFAFWYGGDSPDSHGWTMEKPPVTTEAVPTPTEEITTPTTGPVSTESTGPVETEETTSPVETQPRVTEPETSAPKEEKPERPKETKPKPTEPKETAPKPTEPKETEPPATQAPTVPPETTAPAETEEPDVLTCTISIACKTILDNMDLCDPEKVDIVPENGWILGTTTVEFTQGETVFDILQRVCREKGIHLESEWTPMYNSAYIEGIYNLYEFDVGEGSGWMYKVNGWFPNFGCSQYKVEDGDKIRWVYTCNFGDDVGGSNFS